MDSISTVTAMSLTRSLIEKLGRVNYGLGLSGEIVRGHNSPYENDSPPEKEPAQGLIGLLEKANVLASIAGEQTLSLSAVLGGPAVNQMCPQEAATKCVRPDPRRAVGY